MKLPQMSSEPVIVWAEGMRPRIAAAGITPTDLDIAMSCIEDLLLHTPEGRLYDELRSVLLHLFALRYAGRMDDERNVAFRALQVRIFKLEPEVT